MARSSDPRRPTPFQRGSKRYHSVGGHVPPGDEVENTRDHERIWFELKRTRGCCGCEHPGLKYCFEQADYPTIVCEGLYPAGLTLIDYWPGNPGGSGTDMTLAQGCGASGTTVPETSVLTEFEPDGSWRNGPIFGKRGFGGNATFLGTSNSWSDVLWFPGVAHTIEYFIKPSSTDIALGRTLTACGPFMNANDGGYFTNFVAGGGIKVLHESLSGGEKASGSEVFTADEWHLVHYVRSLADEGFSIYVNGRRVVYATIPTDHPINSDILFTFAGGQGSWVSDLSRYAGAMAPSEIRRRARVMLGVVGLDDAEDEEGGDGTIIEDPTFLITDLGPDQIDGEGVAGYVMMSAGDTGYWESPDGSPFELEARKSQADGYASLDAEALVPEAELGDDWVVTDDPEYLLAKDSTGARRFWVPGQPVPRPTALDQMLRAEANTSDDYQAELAIAFPSHFVYPLTEAAGPFADIPNSGFGDLSLVGSAAVVADPDHAFAGETVIEMGGGTDGLQSASSPFISASQFIFSFWIKLAALPAGTVNIVKFGNLAGVRLLSDGKVEVWHTTPGALATSVSSLPLNEWAHVVAGNDGSGAGTLSAVWIDGVAEDVGAGQFAGSGNNAIIVGGDGLEARIAWLAESDNQLSDDFNAEVAALYATRRPVWTLVDDVSGGSGVDVEENGVLVTAAARPKIDLIAGSNIVIDVVDDGVDDEVEVTISATAPAGSGIESSENGVDVSAAPRGRLNFLDGFGTFWDLSDDGANDEVEISLNLPDASGAAVGDVLTLDGSSEPAWETPSGGGGGGGGYEVEPAAEPPASAHASDDEFDGASLDVKWTWDNQGSATATLDLGSLVLYAPSNGGAHSWRAIFQAAPAGDFTVIAKLRPGTQPVNSHYSGLILRNSTNDRRLVFGPTQFSGQAAAQRLDKWATKSAFSSTFWSPLHQGGPSYFRFRKVGTNWDSAFSYDGITWITANAEAIATFIGAVDEIGLGVNPFSGDEIWLGCDFFRVTEP